MLRNLLSSNMPTIISNDHIVCKTCLRLGESPSTLFKPSNGILFVKDQGLLKHYCTNKLFKFRKIITVI